MDLALNNLQRLICHKIQTNKLSIIILYLNRCSWLLFRNGFQKPSNFILVRVPKITGEYISKHFYSDAKMFRDGQRNSFIVLLSKKGLRFF